MAKKGNLFYLIKSLTKAEKRHFKMFASSADSDTNYLKLFEAVEAQPEYDEIKIRKRFQGQKFTTQLHVTKIYLTELILKSLRNYHQRTSASTEILDLLRDIEILFNRELYDLCHYKIEKALELAQRYEKISLMSEVLSWKRKLMLTSHATGGERIGEILRLERRAIEQLHALHTYWDHTLNIFQRLETDTTLLEHKFISDPAHASTLQANILRHHILYAGNLARGNNTECEIAISTLIDLLENNAERVREEPAPYITALSNKIGLLIRWKRWNEISPLIDKIKAAPEKYQFSHQSKFTLRMWLRVYNLEMEMYRDTRQIEKGVKLIDDIQRFINKHQKVVPHDYLLLFYYQFAYMNLLNKSFKQSLYWLNAILNFNFAHTREEIQCYARLLNVVIHFELNNIIVLRYAVDSCRRFIKKKKMMGSFESAVLSLFSKLSLCRPDEYTKHYQKTHDRLYGSANTPLNSEALDYFDFKTWLEEKVTIQTQMNKSVN